MGKLVLTFDEAKSCGIGMEARCCAYLIAGSDGLECGRVTGLAPLLFLKAKRGEMSARRLPDAPYPECQSAAAEKP